jgi:catechol 2,3-dioxygenase-like lactoylglutathione lyase family enzyme
VSGEFPAPGPRFVFGTVIHRVRELRRAMDWYENALGLMAFDVHDSDPNDTHALFAIGSTVLELWQARPDEELETSGSIAGTHVVWLAEDLYAAHAELTERGADPKPIFEYGPWLQFYLFDPDGNRILVTQLRGKLPWEEHGH